MACAPMPVPCTHIKYWTPCKDHNTPSILCSYARAPMTVPSHVLYARPTVRYCALVRANVRLKITPP